MRRNWVLLLALLGLAVTAAVTLATTPGTNGQIAFRRYADAKQTASALFTVNPDGTAVRQISSPPAGSIDDQPDWAPDGRRVAFSRCPSNGPCRGYVVGADGTGLEGLTPACTRPPASNRVPQGCEDAANLSFSHDGRNVTYTSASGRIRVFKRYNMDFIERSAVTTVGADGTGRRQILRLPRYGGDANWPQYSPDGRMIMFERFNSPLSRPRLGRALFVMNADGKAVHRVTPWKLRAGDNADWAPDSSRILFRSLADQPNDRSQYYTVRPDGSQLTKLTSFPRGRRLFSASFSPDGKQIAFARDDAKGLGDLWLMNADGSNQRVLLQDPKWDSAPDWGPAPR
jgi:Tol biopolymer transport system component